MNIAEIPDKFNRGGYVSFNDTLNRVFNVVMALVLIVLSAPVFVVIAMAIKLQDRGSIYYRGTRLGKDKVLFTMYKFRTLVEDAENKIGARLMDPKYRLETKLGRFLRDTRLDELPQLLNILKGDMNFFGPRPERPLIYETMCKGIPNYDKRFIVKPGLVGYSQLFTPHSADKEIRTLIDNKFLKKYQNVVTDLLMVGLTIIVVVTRVVQKGSVALLKLVKSKLFGLYSEKRIYSRIRAKRAVVYVKNKANDTAQPIKCNLVDINEQAFCITSDSRISGDNLSFEIEVVKKRKLGFELRKKYCLCHGYIYNEKDSNGKGAGKFTYVVMYTAESPLNKYMIRKYLIRESVI
ncbi:MAG: sugar transferase [Nitrospirae bacterium]|nr:sugar transferase [Nitrospirota bacterium]